MHPDTVDRNVTVPLGSSATARTLAPRSPSAPGTPPSRPPQRAAPIVVRGRPRHPVHLPGLGGCERPRPGVAPVPTRGDPPVARERARERVLGPVANGGRHRADRVLRVAQPLGGTRTPALRGIDSRPLRAGQTPAAVLLAKEHMRVAAGGSESRSVERAGHLRAADDDRGVAVASGAGCWPAARACASTRASRSSPVPGRHRRIGGEGFRAHCSPTAWRTRRRPAAMLP